MRANDVVKILGIKKSYLRFLREKGLIHPRMDASGTFCYTDNELNAIRRVMRYRQAGVPVALLQKLFAGKRTHAQVMTETEQLLREKQEALDAEFALCRELMAENGREVEK